MSDDQRKDDEIEVEGHYQRVGANDELPRESDDEADAEVEGHIRYSNVRMD